MVKRKAGKLPASKSQRKKAAKHSGRVLKGSVPNGVLREAWNTRRTGSQNLISMGLAASVNTLGHGLRAQADRHNSHRGVNARSGFVSTSGPSQLDVVRALEVEASRTPNAPRVHVRSGEERAMAAMVGVHGLDFEAMARDIKLNYLQWTTAELRRKYKRWKTSRAPKSSG